MVGVVEHEHVAPPVWARASRSARSFASLPELTRKTTLSGSGSVAASRRA